MPIAINMDEANQQHYEVPDEVNVKIALRYWYIYKVMSLVFLFASFII